MRWEQFSGVSATSNTNSQHAFHSQVHAVVTADLTTGRLSGLFSRSRRNTRFRINSLIVPPITPDVPDVPCMYSDL